MEISGFASSHIGRRSNNEDAYCLLPHLGFYAVADGMGGHEGGEVASRMALDAMARHLERRAPRGVDFEPRHELGFAVQRAASDILAHATGALEEMGTTVAALWVLDGQAYVAHIGDSRVYRLRDGALTQLTRDHSMLNELEDQGSAQLANLLRHRIAHVITRCLSAGCNNEPDIQALDVQPGDVFLLCSDGLSDVLPDSVLEAELAKHPAGAAHQRLVERAYERGGSDNITAVVVAIPR